MVDKVSVEDFPYEESDEIVLRGSTYIITDIKTNLLEEDQIQRITLAESEGSEVSKSALHPPDERHDKWEFIEVNELSHSEVINR